VQSQATLGSDSNVTDDGRRDTDAFDFDDLNNFRGDDLDRSSMVMTARHSIAIGVKKR